MDSPLPDCLGSPYWHYQLVLAWYLHQPESHQLSLQNVSEWVISGAKDRTPGLVSCFTCSELADVGTSDDGSMQAVDDATKLIDPGAGREKGFEVEIAFYIKKSSKSHFDD